MKRYLQVLIAICMVYTVIYGYMVWMCYDTTLKFYEYWGNPEETEAQTYYKKVSEQYFVYDFIMTIGLVALVGFTFMKMKEAWTRERMMKGDE